MKYTCYSCDFQEEVTFIDALRKTANERWWKSIDISNRYIDGIKVYKSKHLCIKCQDIEEIIT